jgi:hypothetical protein
LKHLSVFPVVGRPRRSPRPQTQVERVNIALGTLALDACDAFDGNTDGAVTVDELIAAVNNALSGCV